MLRIDSRGHAAFNALFFCALFAIVAPVRADGAHTRLEAAPNEAELDFREIAQQRPRACTDETVDAVPNTGWLGGASSCAWRGLLRLREWSGTGAKQHAGCVSPQAAWWAWARAPRQGAQGQPWAWRASWISGSVIEDEGADKRIVIVRRLADGSWRVSEWRWSPSTRMATRRWQQGRWDLLAARARQFQQSPGLARGTRESILLWKALETNIGGRIGEIGEQRVNWWTDGLCMQVDAAAPGPQQLQLPYSADDSRLEQRAAMQLQLARRFSKATWLTPFTLAPALAHVKSGAKFYAIWSEGKTLSGQLWIPTKGDGPLVRVRISTSVPPARQVADARTTVERELLSVAAQWAHLND